MLKPVILLLLLPAGVLQAQENITLSECYRNVKAHYPVLRQSPVWEEITSLNKENLNTANLPQITVNGQATYQSEVTRLDISMPGLSIPSVSKDQYRAWAEIRQTIWDGGVTAATVSLEETLLKSGLTRLEVEIYQLNEQVSQAFYTVLLASAQNQILESGKKALQEKLKAITSGVANGVTERSAALVIRAEILQTGQNQEQLSAADRAARKMLSVLTGREISREARFVSEKPVVAIGAEINRPELSLFNTEYEQLDMQSVLLDKTRYPKIFGFGQAGYGKPGLNMLNDQFDSYYLIGFGISWNPFDWQKTERQKKALGLRQQAVALQKEAFLMQTDAIRVQIAEQIEKLDQILKTDGEIIALREEITRTAASRLENDFITMSDYIREQQAETAARLNYELHRIQRDEAIEKYRILTGN